MRRSVWALAAGALLAVSLAPAALAAPHFHSAKSSVTNAGALVVSFDERGLGNDNVTYALTANATALYACINRGGKNPSAANKRSFEGQVAGGGTFEVKNGRVVESITVNPLSAPDFTCPGGQRRVLASVSYTNIVLRDTTNGVSTTAPAVSKTLVAL